MAAQAIVGIVFFSIVAGSLVAISVAPTIGVGGMVANDTVGVFQDLPEYVNLSKLSQRNRIFANGPSGPEQIATVYDQNRQEDSWDEVSQYLKDAAVDGEDKTFYSHGGVDVPSLARAAVSNVSSGSIQSGGSTIAMQVVRNIAVQDALQEPTPARQKAAYRAATAASLNRKLREIKLAIGLDKRYTKPQVLLQYLNIANFGRNNYGVEAAAQAYFSTTAKKVTPAQAASIIAIVQDPSSRNLSVAANYAANRSRRDFILKTMRKAGDLTSAQYDTAINTPVDSTFVHRSVPQNGCLAAQVQYRWMCDYVVRDVASLPQLGATKAERVANWKVGGYDIYTTLDTGMQTVATDALHQLVPNTENRFQLGGAAATVQPGTGRILIMAQNKDYDNTLGGGGPTTTAVNFSVDKATGGSVGFQPGSAYKAFTLIDWLEHGHSLNESLNASVRSLPLKSFTNSCLGGKLAGPTYTFKNDENEQGPTTVMKATQRSINSVFIQMASKLDLCDITNVAKALGVHNGNGDPLSALPACVIGGCDNTIAPLTLAAAYAAIANNGIYCPPVAVDKVVTAAGATIATPKPKCTQAVPANVANTAALALEGPIGPGGTGYAANPRDGTPFLGKTGTTNNSVQTWVVASSTKAATAVWVGNIYGFQQLRKISVGHTQAAVLRHSVFRTIMTYVDARLGRGSPFPPADPALLHTPRAAAPPASGGTAPPAVTPPVVVPPATP